MARDQGERWRLHPMGRLTRAQMYPGAGGGLSLLPSFHLICKRRKRNTEGSEKCSRLNIQLRVAQLPSFRPSRGFQWRLVVELKNTTTTHTHTHTHLYFNPQARGRSPEFRVGVVVVFSTGTPYMHGRASKGSTGLDGGLVAKS
jgi:hypothetical protein